MNANPILLQKKYARVVELFAKKEDDKKRRRDLPNDVVSLFFFYITKKFSVRKSYNIKNPP